MKPERKQPLHKYILAIQTRGFHVQITEDLIPDYPDRPAHYLRTIRLYTQGKLVYKNDGFSNHTLLREALDWVKTYVP